MTWPEFFNNLLSNPTVLSIAIVIFLIAMAIGAAIVVVTVVFQKRSFEFGRIKIGPAPQQPENEELREWISERIKSIKVEMGGAPAWSLYQPAELPQSTIELFKAKTDIENYLRRIVYAAGDHWAGSTWADGETFYSLAQTHALVDQDTLKDISAFYWSISPFIYGQKISEEEFENIKYLVVGIIRKLKSTEKEISRNKKYSDGM